MLVEDAEGNITLARNVYGVFKEQSQNKPINSLAKICRGYIIK